MLGEACKSKKIASIIICVLGDPANPSVLTPQCSFLHPRTKVLPHFKLFCIDSSLAGVVLIAVYPGEHNANSGGADEGTGKQVLGSTMILANAMGLALYQAPTRSRTTHMKLCLDSLHPMCVRETLLLSIRIHARKKFYHHTQCIPEISRCFLPSSFSILRYQDALSIFANLHVKFPGIAPSVSRPGAYLFAGTRFTGNEEARIREHHWRVYFIGKHTLVRRYPRVVPDYANFALCFFLCLSLWLF